MQPEHDLEHVLNTCVPRAAKLAVIHSSLARLAPEPHVTKWTIMRAFRNLVDAGVTLAFPAFTFSFCGGKLFHFRDSRSEVGVLADWAMQLRGAVRTPHPIYSHVVLGPLADELCACPNTTTWGVNSVYQKFLDLDAQVVMFGCSWAYCTPFHYCEEHASVPYRYLKTFNGIADFGHGEVQTSAMMLVRDLETDPANDFSPIVWRLREAGQIRSARLWKGIVESAPMRDIARIGGELLATDPWGLVTAPRKTEHKFRNIRSRAQQPPLKVALLGSSNLHFLKEKLAVELAAHIPDRRIEIHTSEFGQMMQDVLTDGSSLASFDADVTFFVDRVEDLFGVSTVDSIDPETAADKTKTYIEAIRHYRRRSRGWIFINNFAQLTNAAYGSLDSVVGNAAGAVIAAQQALLTAGLADIEQLRFIDLAAAAATHDGPVLDPRLWFIGRFPFSDTFSAHLAHKCAGMVLAATGRTARLLLLDLDNTLWGGVLGEDGISGVKVSGDYPGNAYREFQRTLKLLSQRGIALAICSKNDEPHALDALERVADMELRREHFVAHRINWSPKWKNAIAICEELNLGLGSAMFIDDNPAERELMRLQCPSLNVLELPADPARYTEALLSSPYLECVELTSEDLQRTQSYKVRSELQSARGAFENTADFFASLRLKLHLNPLSDSNRQRALQLIHKTNQFNTTTRRYDHAQIERLAADGADIVVIGVEDKFSAFENVGVLVLRWDESDGGSAYIDSYLLSCRVLGKGIESGVIEWLKAYARSRKAALLIGEVIETERNSPARLIFKDTGFHQIASGQWRFELTAKDPVLPSWLTIVDNIGEGRYSCHQ